MSLEQIIDFILENPLDFQNEDGFFDRDYIQDRFDLTDGQLIYVMRRLD